MKQNYSNKDGESPFKKGKMEEVVKPARPKVRRIRRTTTKEVADDLYIDLVQVLANNGITLSKVHSLATALVKRGWVKQQKIESPKERT